MYLRKISPSTTCLYSAASMLDRKASAARHSSLSNPTLAPVFFALLLFDSPFFAAVFVGLFFFLAIRICLSWSAAK